MFMGAHYTRRMLVIYQVQGQKKKNNLIVVLVQEAQPIAIHLNNKSLPYVQVKNTFSKQLCFLLLLKY